MWVGNAPNLVFSKCYLQVTPLSLELDGRPDALAGMSEICYIFRTWSA
jgi:hypothetical protein